MKRTPLNTWRFYNGRAAVELIIKELKGNYPLGKFQRNISCKRGLFPHPLVLLQSHQLVQTPLSPKGVSEHDA